MNKRLYAYKLYIDESNVFTIKLLKRKKYYLWEEDLKATNLKEI